MDARTIAADTPLAHFSVPVFAIAILVGAEARISHLDMGTALHTRALSLFEHPYERRRLGCGTHMWDHIWGCSSQPLFVLDLVLPHLQYFQHFGFG